VGAVSETMKRSSAVVAATPGVALLEDARDDLHADPARLSLIEALRFRSVEPGRRFQLFLKPRKVFNQHVSVRDFNVRRISTLVRKGEGAILNACPDAVARRRTE
jgi:hypothetical protein